MTRVIYMDHNATIPVRKEVIDSIKDLMDKPLNPSATHSLGQEAKAIVEKARLKILSAVGANPEHYQVIFTSCATEANNLALKGLKDYKVVTSVIEHPSVFNIVGEGLISVNGNGIIDLNCLEEICKSLEGQKFIVSVMAANNETGAIQPIEEATEIVHKFGGLIHSDAVQAFGKVRFSINELDLVTLSSHKIGGDFGAAALVLRKNLQLEPFLNGGGQEGRMRSGTHNTRSIHGFAVSCELAVNELEIYKDHLERIRNYIQEEIFKFAPDAIVFSGNAVRLPNTLSISMPNVKSETQLIHFDVNGIAVSAGSACSSTRLAIPRVQMSMGYSEEIARTSLRVSLGKSNTIEEAKRFVECWKQLYSQVNNNKNAA